MKDENEILRKLFQLKEDIKTDNVFGWIYRKMIAILDSLENILETLGGIGK